MSLRSAVISGVVWTGGARLASQLMNWAITIVVIRLLAPADYGLLAMATVFGSFLLLMAQAGLGAALVQAREMDEVKLRRVFGAVIVINAALATLQFAAAPAIAYFFQEPRLVAIVQALALQFLVMIFTVIPVSLLARGLDFRRQAVVDVLSGACGALATLALALSGYGVWALVLGNLITMILKAVAINAVAPFLKRPDFSFTGLHDIVVFGGEFTASRVLWWFYSQADVLIAGRILGKELLGLYSVTMHLASLPVQRLAAVINEVAFPAFARTQHDDKAVAAYTLMGLRLMSFYAFPVLWGISSIAPEIVAVLLGEKWAPAVLPLQLLPLVMPLSMLSTFLNSAFQGTGRTRIVFMNVLTATVVMPLAFLVGVHWGLLGLSLAWIVGFPVVFLTNMARMLPVIGLRWSELGGAVARSALAAAVMYACVTATRQGVSDAVSAPLLMGSLIAVGAASYAVLSLLANRGAVSEVVALLTRR